ncbi:hypothetical protein, partial [Robbsia andropogonis]
IIARRRSGPGSPSSYGCSENNPILFSPRRHFHSIMAVELTGKSQCLRVGIDASNASNQCRVNNIKGKYLLCAIGGEDASR